MSAYIVGHESVTFHIEGLADSLGSEYPTTDKINVVPHPDHSSAVALSQLCSICRNFFNHGVQIRQQCNDANAASIDKDLFSPGPFPYHTETATWIASAKEGCVLCALFLEKLEKTRSIEGKSGALALLEISPKGLDIFGSWTRKHVDWDSNESGFFFLAIYLREALNCGPYFRVDVELRVPLDSMSSYQPAFSTSTGSDQALDFAKGWLQRCMEEHPECNQDPSISPPTRLVEIGANGIRLYTTQAEDSSLVYCTLSHCWGIGSFFKLTQSNIDSLHQSIPLQRLSRTFQDAIAVTHKLGYKFIWIDSLCIVQDDENDWRRESRCMGQVYGSAILNIAAAHAENGSVGLFTERDIKKVQRHFVRTDTSDLYELLDDLKNDRCLVSSPLAGRAWAFQERFLSRRTLHFTSEEVFCECHTRIVCETFPDGIPTPRFVSDDSISRLDRSDYGSWFKSVTTYSSAKLAYPTDRLVAFSGVAQHFQQLMGYEYVAGLWRTSIERQMCFRYLLRSSGSSLPTTDCSYRAPSFSWASMEQPVSWNLNGTFILSCLISKIYIAIVDISVVLLGSDPLGPIKDASMKLHCGPFITEAALSAFIKEKGWSGGVLYDSAEDETSAKDDVYMLPLIGKHREDHIKVFWKLFKLLDPKFSEPHEDPVTMVGLAVRKSASHNKGTFKRVGVFEVETREKTYEATAGLILNESGFVMDEELYQEILERDESGNPRYSITLV